MVFDRPRSEVQPCPPQPGLDLMRERIAWLSDTLRAPIPTTNPSEILRETVR
jgi:hypothetical protein